MFPKGVRKIKKSTSKIKKSQINNEMIFKHFAASSTEAFSVWDNNLNLIYSNPASMEMFHLPGTKEADIFGKNIAEFTPDIKKSGKFDSLMKVIKTGESFIAEEVRASPIFGDKYYSIKAFKIDEGVGVIMEDISERIKAQKALEYSEARFKKLIESAALGVVIIDSNYKVIFANETVGKYTGYSQKELLNSDFRKYIAKEDIGLISERYQDRQEGKDIPNNYEFYMTAKNNEKKCIELCSNTTVDQNGQVYTMAQLLDITERKLLEIALKSHADNLEKQVHARTNELIQAEKMASLGQLVAGVAHEINNPLSYLKCNSEIMKEDIGGLKNLCKKCGFQTNLVEMFEKILNSNIDGIKRIERITKTLKRFSKPQEAGGDAADLNDGIRDTLLMMETKLKHRIDVHEDYGNIPQIQCNKGHLNQVFMNLLLNSAQSMEKGDIWIRTRRENNKVYIDFEDNGKGISKSIINKIYDPFFTTKESGSGLGLSISYKIIKEHKGKINIISEPGKGTTVSIELPC